MSEMFSTIWSKLDPGFLAPVWLPVGVLAVVAVLLLQIGARRRRREGLRIFAAAHLIEALTASVSPARRLLKEILLLLAVASVFIALARPHLFYEWREDVRSGLDVLLAVDCSKSMLTEDVKPNRIERAKLAIADFADRLPDNRLGLIAFAGDAFLECPLTLDHEAFQDSVRELDTDIIPKPGTDIATAIEQATLALQSQAANMKFLILVTDGEDLEGRVIEAAQAAARNGLKIFTVGVGTAAGGLIPERDDSGAIAYLHDSDGQIVQSKLDENTLRRIAEITGGAYVPLGQNGEGLDEIYNRYIATLPKHLIEQKREKIQFERFEWPLTLAILLLVAEFMTSERVKSTAESVSVLSTPKSRPVKRRTRSGTATASALIGIGLLLAAGLVPTQAADAGAAERDYQAGKYDAALEKFRSAANDQPDRSDLQYNLGDAAYKAGAFLEAEDAFRKTLETSDLDMQEKGYYNLGNAQFKHGEALQKDDANRAINLWKSALRDYDSAMKLKPSADAKYNYEFVKKKLEQLKQQQQQKQSKNGKSQPNQKDQSGKDSQQGESGNQDNQPPDSQPQDQNNPNPKDGGQNGQQPQPQPGDPSQQENKPDAGDPTKKDEPKPADSLKEKDPRQSARSQGRSEDQQDPEIKSRKEAENLLDSLKDDEGHVTSRLLNGNNEPPPPPPSGKDW